MKKLLVLLVFPLLLIGSVNAQSEIGVSIGTSNMLGDFGGGLGDGTIFIKDIEPSMFRFSAGVFYRYNFAKFLAIRGQVLYGTLASDDELAPVSTGRFDRGLKSTSPVIDGTLQAEFNFIPLKFCSGSHRFTPYLAAGIGVTYTNPTIGERDDDIDNIALEAEYIEDAGSNLGINVPVSFGLKYKTPKNLVLGLETTYRMAFTDNLDLYNRQDNDAYIFVTANVSYVFCRNGRMSKSVSCPAF